MGTDINPAITNFFLKNDFDFHQNNQQKIAKVSIVNLLLETFHKRGTSNIKTNDKTIIYMKKIREAREFELYNKKVSIIDV